MYAHAQKTKPLTYHFTELLKTVNSFLPISFLVSLLTFHGFTFALTCLQPFEILQLAS